MDIKTVEHIAQLANLELDEKEKEKMAVELTRIVEYISKINELKTQEIDPAFHIGYEKKLREDEEKPSFCPISSLSSHIEDKQFKVPKVIE
ncbi:TPA: Asp-tRNA(Asn)/Glu-tRNA(Gln) amidotransferase subunit GatB [bacterium]|nr:Asp-tRNA(Asn)/Glu-tRNA(Gln) amidotransferase subunit GatB [bacterium]